MLACRTGGFLTFSATAKKPALEIGSRRSNRLEFGSASAVPQGSFACGALVREALGGDRLVRELADNLHTLPDLGLVHAVSVLVSFRWGNRADDRA